MKTIAVIPCGSQQIWDKDPTAVNRTIHAKEAYISEYHRLCKHYAIKFSDRWVILSTKHGYLDPDDVIPGKYNVPDFIKPDSITLEKAVHQISQKKLSEYGKVLAIGGMNHVRFISDSFKKYPTIEIVHVLKGKGDIKGQIAWMNQCLNEKAK